MSNRQQAGRLGGLKSWANTVDRTARTEKARANGPASLDWHLKRLPAKFDDATDDQRQAAAEAARRLYYAEIAQRSARVRSRGAA